MTNDNVDNESLDIYVLALGLKMSAAENGTKADIECLKLLLNLQ